MLETRSLTANYGQFRALFGIDFYIKAGETVAIVGANGAGKSTLLRSISGVLQNQPEMIVHRGEQIGALSSAQILKRGISMVPEGRKLFPSLTVEENILIGGQQRKVKGPWNLQSIYDLFPILKSRKKGSSTALSGGQQQMVAIARGLMSNPELLLCDEISLGLAPIIIRDIYAAVPRIKDTGAALVIVEQDVQRALTVADRVYCMMEGRITLEDRASNISQARLHTAYFGGGS